MNHTNAFFLPFWEGNPYHRRLRRDLQPHNVRVTGARLLPDVEEAPEIVHLHGFRLALQVHNKRLAQSRCAAFLTRLDSLIEAGCAIVVTLHDLHGNLGYHPDLDATLTKEVLSCSHQIIYHSASALERLIAEFGTDFTQRATLIPHPNYINAYPDWNRETARETLNVKPDETVFLSLGAMRESKGPEELVQAFKQWQPAEKVRLILAGPIRFNTPVATLKAAAEQDPRIVYHPEYIADDRLGCYLRASDCAVLPYKEITTSGSLVLAMSFGLPVLAPNAWCFADLVDDSGGVLYPLDSDHGLLSGLQETMSRRDAFTSMGQRNFDYVRQDCPPRQVADRTWAVYQQAMKAV